VHKFQPDVVIGTGGYVCGPILLAASLMHIPTLIQEQNVVPGITNKILSKFVTKIAAGTEEAMKHFPADKVVFTGNPIRSEVLSAQREDGAAAFGFDPKKKTVLVSGGSRGARAINQAMIGVLKHAADYPEVQFLHVTGKRGYQNVLEALAKEGVELSKCPHLLVKPYLYNMPQAMAMADLAIFRAGATGLAELTARGIPSILIPYPYAAENHQEHNAKALQDAGAARMILDRDLTAESLNAVLAELLSEPDKLQAMAKASRKMGRPQAASDIADIVLEIAKG
ncbi:UDP-N-acetylglucosamine--N-acetylmuramyl-(pentapeptide) pyrophosphoryl-undecaprenol N-acetylglucosamine transferase, partial [Mitsuokella sp.]|uniref:UDP-N-acetylglucosamine--N-acetylmuramyl- (pentapeptide) pyrophosphoryl-undecaprenol N-acetylglucosamine transferase n=1 Tax=Mitsuokella sp. TaxID=2049034 RepID=UPI003D7D79A1